MTKLPILFRSPMVRAILAGTKCQTRRVITNRNSRGNYRADELLLDDPRVFADPGPSPAGNPGWYLHAPVNAPLIEQRRGWRPGDCCPEIIERLYPWVFPSDLLWVRETWQHHDWTEEGEPFIRYAADGHIAMPADAPDLSDRWAGLSTPENYAVHGRACDQKWRPSIFMPRWASRITLEVTDVRVERLNDISRGDAMDEGCPFPNMAQGPDPRQWYADLWNELKGPGSWAGNPWVWVVEFRRLAA